MEFNIIVLVILTIFAIQATYRMKKLELKQKELLWRIESMETSFTPSEPIH